MFSFNNRDNKDTNLIDITVSSYKDIIKADIFIFGALATIIALNIILITSIKIKLNKRVRVIMEI